VYVRLSRENGSTGFCARAETHGKSSSGSNLDVIKWPVSQMQ
jgi:hypothetical protein